MKKAVFTTIGMGILFLAHTACAAVSISEIMYDLDGTDTDREWVEIYNDGTEGVDLSAWKFVEGNTNHGLVITDGSATLAPNSYAIIADKPDKFKLDWPNFTGTIFDSSFSLINEPGEELSLKDNTLTVVNTVTYDNTVGAQGDGNSLQKINSVFVSAAPTPGAVNVASATTGTQTEETATVTTGGTGSGGSVATLPAKPKKVIEPVVPKISTEIIAKSAGFVGIPMIFEPVTLGYSKEILSRGLFTWNFGDGTVRTSDVNQKQEYRYDYPGEYVVTLEYVRNPYMQIPDATDRVIVTIIDPVISILSVDQSRGAITFNNSSPYEIDLSGWTVIAGNKSFTFPKNSFILSKKNFILSPKTSFFNGTDVSLVYLKIPAGEIVTQYPLLVKENQPQPNSSSQNNFKPIAPIRSTSQNMNITEDGTDSSYMPVSLPLDFNTPAESLESAAGMSKFVVPIGFGVLVLGASVGSVIWVRKRYGNKKTESVDDEADEFEIVE